jgi:hypothetical protein
MTPEEFIAKERQGLRNFEKFWQQECEKTPELYPATMPNAEWRDQFLSF